MRKFLALGLLMALLIGTASAALFESGTKDAQPMVLYGKYNNTIVPVKVAADGTVGAGGGGISGLTTTYIPKATSSSTIGDSSISDTSGLIGVNKATSTSDLDIQEVNYFDLVYTYSGSYTSRTVESKTTYGTAFTVFFDNTQYLYVGKSTTFKDITINVRQFTTASNTLNAEYWNGSAWTTLTINDNTNNLQNSGTVTYTVPGSWATTAVNSQVYYWIRMWLTNTPSTAPTVYSVRPGSNSLTNYYASISDTVAAFGVQSDGNIVAANPSGVLTSISTPATFVVGLVGSRQGRRVDYMCTGAKDQVCIQKAITACGGNPCKIVLLEGTYNLTASIEFSQDHIWLDGMGWGKTILKQGNNTSPILNDSTASLGSPRKGSIVTNIEFDRSSDTKDATITRKCISLPYSQGAIIDHVYAHDGGATCIATDFSNGTIVSNSRMVNCGTTSASTGNSGLGMGTGAYSTEPLIMVNNVITGSGFAGILIEDQTNTTESSNYIASNNIITGGAQYGIVIRGAKDVVATGNVIRSNTKDGVYIQTYGGSSYAPSNILISSNLINDNTLYGINATSTGITKLQISNNDLTNNGSGPINNGLTSITDLNRLNNLGDTENFLATHFRVLPPSAQTIAAGNTIAADGCGTIKKITSSGAVTTDTTNTFTAPAAGNSGCCMDVVNSGSNNITLDNNANFISAGGTDVVMTGNDSVRVCSDGSKWYQISALLAN